MSLVSGFLHTLRLSTNIRYKIHQANDALSGRNTLLCRMVHQNMVPYRPSVHCPHIGKTGGGYCNDAMSYESTVTQNYFKNYPFGYTDRGPHSRALENEVHVSSHWEDLTGV